MDNDVTRCDLKGYKGSLEDEEVPSGGEAKGLVNIATSKANEWTGDRQICHLSGNQYVCGMAARGRRFGFTISAIHMVTHRMKVHLVSGRISCWSHISPVELIFTIS